MKRFALFSVTNKTNLIKFAKFIEDKGYTILSSSGTYDFLKKDIKNIDKIENITNVPELLDGRVKTLHPNIHAGILYKRNSTKHINEMIKHNLKSIDIVVSNLYDFNNIINSKHSEDAIDHIDIGGHTLIRAGAKNFRNVLTVVDPNDYENIMDNFHTVDNLKYAGKAFNYVTEYDMNISKYFNGDKFTYNIIKNKNKLRYGCNPHQESAVYDNPFKILNGSPSYINMLDAITSWQLVSDIHDLTNKKVATSFKHATPTGVSLENHTTDLSGIASAYKSVRNIDPLSSFGDFIALSHEVDSFAAKYIKTVVSDGIIAPSYTKEAFNILKKKKKGNYIILESDKKFTPPDTETRELYGVTLEQSRNKYLIDDSVFEGLNIPKAVINDMKMAFTTLKYTPSNSITIAYNNQVIGIGAGQQNRVDCMRIAGDKAKKWLLRQHPKYKEYEEKINKIKNLSAQEKLTEIYELLKNEKEPITNNRLVMASDGFIPFTDTIHVAIDYGIKYIIQPGGSINDDIVKEMCEKNGITMVTTGYRMFYH